MIAEIPQDSGSTQTSSFTTRLPTSVYLQGCATVQAQYLKALPDHRAGIYPREPRSKKKASKSSTPSTTFYYTRDIQYLLHEPLLAKFRDHKALGKKISRHLGRGEVGDAARLEKKGATKISLDHIIKERYPTVSSPLGYNKNNQTLAGGMSLIVPGVSVCRRSPRPRRRFVPAVPLHQPAIHVHCPTKDHSSLPKTMPRV